MSSQKLIEQISWEKNKCFKTHPFQISAFFFNPQGERPLLKFHCLPISREVVVTAEVVGVIALLLVKWQLGKLVILWFVTNPLVDVTIKAVKRERINFVIMMEKNWQEIRFSSNDSFGIK